MIRIHKFYDRAGFSYLRIFNRKNKITFGISLTEKEIYE